MNNHTLHEKVPLLTHGLIENRLIHNFDTCNGYLRDPFEKEALWVVSPASFSRSDGSEPLIQEGESFSFARVNTRIWTANLRGR
jgi:hypothetical protein